MKISTTIKACTLVGVGIYTVYLLGLSTITTPLSASPTPAVAQVPELLAMIQGEPDDTVMVKTRVVAKLQDWWQLPLTVTVTGVGRNYRGTVTDVAPDQFGKVEAYTYIPLEELGNGVEVQFWGNPVAAAKRGFDGPFLSAAEGLSASFTMKPQGDMQTGLDIDVGTIILTTPPLVGSVALSPAYTGTGLFFSLADGVPGRYEGMGNRGFSWREPLLSGTGLVEFWSWSKASFWDFEVQDVAERTLVATSIRRNATTPPAVTVPNRFDVGVDIDAVAFPTATHILIVPPEHHQPNAQSPTGSDVDFYDALTEYATAGVKLGAPVGGVFKEGLFGLDVGGCYLEVWGGWDSTVLESVPNLLGYQQLSTTPGVYDLTF